MPWLGTVDSSHWTADFRLARLLDYAYRRSGRPWPVVLVGLGEPGGRPGQVGPAVAAEIARVHPYVFGQPPNPVGRRNVDATFFRITQEFPDAFVVAVDGASGLAEEDGHVVAWSARVEPDEEFLEAQQALGGGPGQRPRALPAVLDEKQVPRTATVGTAMAVLPIHVGLIGVVGPVVASPAAHARRLQSTCDAMIDGILRFFYRIGLAL